MKRILLVMVLLTAGLGTQAQDMGKYRFDMTLRIRDPFDNASGSCTNAFTLWADYTSGDETEIWDENLNPIGTGFKDYSNSWDFPGNVRLENIRFRGVRRYKKLIPFGYTCEHASGSEDTRYEYFSTPTYSNTLPYDAIPAYESEVTINIYPIQTNLYYLNKNTNAVDPSNNDIASEHTARLRAYPDAPYTWEFEHPTQGWKPMPPQFQGQYMIDVTGYDLFSEADFLDILRTTRSVQVRVKWGNTVMDNMPLTAKLSAPRIVGIEPDMESCFNAKDATLKVCFNRALHDGELLSFRLNGNDMEDGPAANIPELQSGNCFTIPGLTPGHYEVGLFNKFAGQPGFSEGEGHHDSDDIAIRPAISGFTATPEAVHCYDGEDGKIVVRATGGTGSFTAYLLKGTTPQQQLDFASSGSATFLHLPTDQYIVRLKDTKGCDPKVNDTINKKYPKVDQPPQPNRVVLLAGQPVEPLGFGLTNGHVTVLSDNGTGPYTFQWKDAANNPRTPEPSQGPNSAMTSKLSGIGTGRYYVRTQDANFALADASDPKNQEGCWDTLSVFVPQPPLLEVYMEQHRYVSCFGYDDGKLVAHGTGGRPILPANGAYPYQYDWYEVNMSVNDTTLTPIDPYDSIASNRPSTWYRVKLTDRNGIIAWSEDYKLIQPNLLTISFNTSTLLCNGDTNGTSQATVQGGTQGYRYTWNTGDTTSAVANLQDGWYSMVVKDVRGCTTFGQTEVKVPDGLAVESTVVDPTCFQSSDGSITLHVSGGRKPYDYQWQSVTGDSTAIDLPEGVYTVRIVDDNDCFIVREYTLDDPALLGLDLGPDRVLCKDQTLPLDIAFDDPAPQYRWTKDGAPFAQTATVELVDAGTYGATVTDSKGCTNTGDIRIERNEAEIAATLMVASRAPVSERVRIANISHPFPERVEWILPASAVVIEETPEYVDLMFVSRDTYTVGLVSFVGSCEKVAYTTVKIVDKSQLTDYRAPDEPFIKQYTVTPNPNNGRFEATVELREVGDFTLTLTTLQGSAIASQSFKQQTFAKASFDVSAEVGRGVYILQLKTREGQSTFKVVIQ